MAGASPQIDSLRTLAVLPARIGSTRLPRKMLLAETGLPLFAHSARNAARCPHVVRVVIATDSEEVRAAAVEAQVEVVMTSADHVCGTDRVCEATRSLGAEFDVVVNIQADEPDVEPADLSVLVRTFEAPDVEAATLCTPLADEAEALSTSVVKVVRDAAGDALYFSRSPVPSRDHAREGAELEHALQRHVGVYAFRPAALERFCELPVGRLEALESLEQLRWLEAGRRMRVVTAGHAPRGIDTRADYEAFVARSRASPSSPLEPSESR